jgi:hypothetical protein
MFLAFRAGQKPGPTEVFNATEYAASQQQAFS